MPIPVQYQPVPNRLSHGCLDVLFQAFYVSQGEKHYREPTERTVKAYVIHVGERHAGRHVERILGNNIFVLGIHL